MPGLPSMQRRVPSGHGGRPSMLYLHSPSVRPMLYSPDARGPHNPGLPQWLKVIDKFATKIFSLHPITCELCNRVGHLNFQCTLFHDRIVAKNSNNLITLELYNELCFILGV